MPEYIGYGRETQGTEPSQYLEEKKSNEIPQVAASERGRAQTHAVSRRAPLRCGGCRAFLGGFHGPREVKNLSVSGTPLGRATREGESPVREIETGFVGEEPEYGGARETLPESGRTTFQG